MRSFAVCVALLLGLSQWVHAGGNTFTYQGLLEDQGQSANGSYDFEVQVYPEAEGGAAAQPAQFFDDVPVVSGRFLLLINAEDAVFTGPDRWLEVRVRNADSPTDLVPLLPRQRVFPAPYAQYSHDAGFAASVAPDSVNTAQIAAGAVTSNRLATGAVGALQIDPTQVQRRVVAACGAGQAIHTVNEDGSVVCEFLPPAGWSLSGNAATDPVNHYVGTSDATALELRTNGQRNLRIEPGPTDGSDSARLVLGSPWNVNSEPNRGAVIGGGGASQFGDPGIADANDGRNRVFTHYATLAGGYGNRIGAGLSPAEGAFASIGGGYRNTASGNGAHIGGGLQNQANQTAATVAGGSGNSTFSANFAAIGGGESNQASGNWSTVAGGQSNSASALHASIGGGAGNQATGPYARVAGGNNNIAGGLFATVAGGRNNAANADDASVAGGWSNLASANGAGVGSGTENQAGGNTAWVGGGQANSASGISATVSGGAVNTSNQPYSGVAGGVQNVASGFAANVAGGDRNQAGANFAAVAGGQQNEAIGSHAAIGGGAGNRAQGNTSVVAGGSDNRALGQSSIVSGGENNRAEGSSSSVSGGANNAALGFFATVPGGASNCAGAPISFAGGQLAKVRPGADPGTGSCAGLPSYPGGMGDSGTFLWADASSGTAFVSEGANRFEVRATGGARIVTSTDAISGVATAGVVLPAGGGAWASLSDRQSKAGIEAVDTGEVLAAVLALPVYHWHYTSQGPMVRHLGPMAQDFHAAFGLNGEDDRHISSIDPDGVSLAAIQGLYAHFQAQQDADARRIEALESQLESLRAALDGLLQVRRNRHDSAPGALP